MQDIDRILGAFDRACAEVGVAYALVGGFAAMAWGIPRATQDIDVLLHLEEAHAAPLSSALARSGLKVAAADLSDARWDGGHVTIFDTASPWHIDVKVTATDDERQELDRAVSVALGDAVVRVASPEDALVFKLVYGSPQDLVDAQGIWDRSGASLDLDYLLKTAAKMQVVEGLKALMSTGLAPSDD